MNSELNLVTKTACGSASPNKEQFTGYWQMTLVVLHGSETHRHVLPINAAYNSLCRQNFKLYKL